MQIQFKWHSLSNQIQLQEWFWTADSCHTFHANNTHKHFGKFQYRGTFWLAASHTTTHISSAKCDPSKLGRCVSIGLFRQTFGYYLCPCTNMANCIQSISIQYLWFFASINWHCDPWEAFLTDFGSFIQVHQDAGDSIILCGDMNIFTKEIFCQNIDHILW